MSAQTLTLYTTKQYISEMVQMARCANARAVQRKRKARNSVVMRDVLVAGAEWNFDFARKCMADARIARPKAVRHG